MVGKCSWQTILTVFKHVYRWRYCIVFFSQRVLGCGFFFTEQQKISQYDIRMHLHLRTKNFGIDRPSGEVCIHWYTHSFRVKKWCNIPIFLSCPVFYLYKIACVMLKIDCKYNLSTKMMTSWIPHPLISQGTMYFEIIDKDDDIFLTSCAL